VKGVGGHKNFGVSTVRRGVGGEQSVPNAPNQRQWRRAEGGP